jgi:hypothetical protein
MGQFPHQWVNIYTSCAKCKEWMEFDLKFTDGVLAQVVPHKKEDL